MGKPAVIGTLAILLVCQLVGETAARLLGVPVPGPVLGMLLLFAVLAARGGAPALVSDTCSRLLAHLGLLFVPAGVGVITHLERLRDQWLALGVTLVVSTLAAIVVTAAVLHHLLRAAER